MALSGLHVAFGSAAMVGPVTFYDGPRGKDGPMLFGDLVSSETLAVPGTTITTAPPYSISRGYPVASVRCSKDAWVSIGTSPNPNANPRRFLAAAQDLYIIVNPGDRIAWAEA